MKLLPTVRIEGQITISDKEAELLFHLTSFGLIDWFAKTCSHKYTADELRESLRRVNSLASRIVSAREEAEKSIKAAGGGT